MHLADPYLGRMPTAIVTGASRGLGLALARVLARDRWRLVIDARGSEALERVRAELAQLTDVVALPGAAELLRALPLDRCAIVTSCTRPLAEVRIRAGKLPSPMV